MTSSRSYSHKALLKTGKLKCDDLTDEESEQADDCTLEIILREIVNNQNAQIQTMRAILEAKNYPQENDCKVPIDNKSSNADMTEKQDKTISLGTSGSNHINHNEAAFVTLVSTTLMMIAISLSYI